MTGLLYIIALVLSLEDNKTKKIHNLMCLLRKHKLLSPEDFSMVENLMTLETRIIRIYTLTLAILVYSQKIFYYNNHVDSYSLCG